MHILDFSLCILCIDKKSLLLWKNIKCIMHPQHSTIKQAFIFHCTLLFTLWGQRLTLTSKMEVMFGKTRYGSLLLRALARQKAVWARACGLIFGPPEADPYYIPLHYFTLLLLPTTFNYLCCPMLIWNITKGIFSPSNHQKNWNNSLCIPKIKMFLFTIVKFHMRHYLVWCTVS